MSVEQGQVCHEGASANSAHEASLFSNFDVPSGMSCGWRVRLYGSRKTAGNPGAFSVND